MANDWLDDLLDEYPTNRTDSAIARLARVFADIPDEVMRTAVDNYMRHGQYFPKIADLRPFVDMAQEDMRGDWLAAHEPITAYPDIYIYEWEVSRNTMRPLVEIDREIAAARAELRAMVRQ